MLDIEPTVSATLSYRDHTGSSFADSFMLHVDLRQCGFLLSADMDADVL